MNSRPFQHLWLPLFLGLSLHSLAHQGSTSYLSFVVEEDQIHGRWDIPVRDLNLALDLQAEAQPEPPLDELSKRFAEVQSYAMRHLRLSVNGAPKTVLVTNAAPLVQKFADGASMALLFIVTNLANPQTLEVDYRFMFDRKPLDRAFMQLESRGVTQTAVFTANRPTHRFDLAVRKPWKEFLSFGVHGVWHIWIGFDHILFLVALLLPAVLRFEQNQWLAVSGFREAFFNVFKVVTAFTVAHSLTLSLAALGLVTLPSRWVESAIAASVLVAAANNIRPFFRGPVWLVAFIFGLIHGFGFASVLGDLGLPRGALLEALIGFNLGVEAGQLAIVSVFLPFAYAARRFPFYRLSVLRFGSTLIALVAGLWFVERLFDWQLFS